MNLTETLPRYRVAIAVVAALGLPALSGFIIGATGMPESLLGVVVKVVLYSIYLWLFGFAIVELWNGWKRRGEAATPAEPETESV